MPHLFNNKQQFIERGYFRSVVTNQSVTNIKSLSGLGRIFFYLFSVALFFSCRKLIAIDPPINSISTTQVFADSADVNSAILGIYTNLINSGSFSVTFGSGAFTVYTGSSADELLPYDIDGDQFSSNALLSNNAAVSTNFWNPGFQYIYQTNAILDGLEQTSSLSSEMKARFSAETRFLRSFFYFYLVNLYGDVPIINSINYHKTNSAPRSLSTDVYKAIVDDLGYAIQNLPDDFSLGGGERIRASKWAAKALLARVYLYREQWADAFQQANEVIANTGSFSLDSLGGAFLANSLEAILQLQINSTTNTFNYNATPEGFMLIPLSHTRPPYYYLTNELLDAFEIGDRRRDSWVDSTKFGGTTYYYPFKYKVGPKQAAANANVTEYYMVLRLGEQYLIRAEAQARGAGMGIPGALNDLNVIRERAGLSDYAGGQDQASVLNAIWHEGQIELFAEWGHRWFDLKRTNQAHEVLSGISYKQPWRGDYQLLYPIHVSELQADPNLVQNKGY